MCHVLGISASGYYAWRERPECPRAKANHALLEDIRLVHTQSSCCYGAPRVHAVLRRRGRPVGRSRIERLMRRAGIRGLAALPRRTRTTDSRHNYPIAPNRLQRNFKALAPNQIWLADLTYIPTGEGWLYFAAILDMHTRKIVGWCMRDTLHTEIALEALNMAVQRQRPSPGLPHHSDRGIQFAGRASPGAVRLWGGTSRIVATGMRGQDEHETLARLTAFNAPIHRVRARIENIFGTWKRSYGLRRMRWKGLAKAAVQVHLTAIACNLKRSINLPALPA